MVSLKKTGWFLLTCFSVGAMTGCGNFATPSADIPTDTSFNEIEFAQMQGDWVLTTVPINNNFLFREIRDTGYTTFSSYNVWDFEEDPTHVSDFLAHVFELVAFREDHVYVLASSPARGHEIGWYTTLARINYRAEYIDHDTAHTDGGIFGSIQFAYNLRFYFDDQVTHFYHIDARRVYDGGIRSTLNRSVWSIEPSQNELSEMNAIWEITSARHPFVAYEDDHIIFIYIDDTDYVLGYMKYENTLFVELLRFPFTMDEDGRMSGRLPVYAAGNGYGIYFQIITLDNGFLDFDGESTLYFFSFEGGHYKPVLQLSDHITYINGRDNILVFNYHSVEDPNALTGRMVMLEDETIITIPSITPVNPIIQSVIKDDVVFIVSRNDIIAYDIYSQIFSRFSLEEATTRVISTIIFSDRTFGWLTSGEEGIVFHRLQFVEMS